MGSSYNAVNGRWPSMCYNAPKLMQLNWVDQPNIRDIVEEDLTTSYTNTDLYGVYHSRTHVSNGRKMVMKINLNNSNVKYFISYNAQKHQNVQTQMGGDLVLVHKRSGSTGASELVASLISGHAHFSDEYTISSGNEYITIKVTAANSSIGFATVGVKKSQPRCKDYPNWYYLNSWKEPVDCGYFTYRQTSCNTLSSKTSPSGIRLDEACCACGGGTVR